MTLTQHTVPDATTIAEEAFVFAYPLLRTDRAMTQATAARTSEPDTLRTPVNRLIHDPSIPDTLRLSGWLDLGPEPVVLSAPDTSGRYYVLWLRDAWNTMFASTGARTTGTGSRAFAVLGPDRHGARLPAGVTPIAAPTRIAHVAGCIEVLSDRDDASHEQIAADFRVAPLSRWRNLDHGVPAVPGARTDRRPTGPAEQVEKLDARSFFSEVFRLIGDNPPEPADRAGLDRLRAIAPLQEAGAWERLTPELRAALEHGVCRGREAVRAVAARSSGERVGRWRVSYDTGRYGTDYLRRAGAARAGLGADTATDALAAVLETDSDGRPLTGRDRYVLRFAPDATPPVNGFWSLTTRAVGDATPQGLPSCHCTGDLRGLTLDRDGSLPIQIQRRPPAALRKANWLPTPPGRFSVVLRLYWPCEEALQRRWSPPPLTRLEPALAPSGFMRSG